MLNNLRSYVIHSRTKFRNIKLEEQLAKKIEEDYIKERKLAEAAAMNTNKATIDEGDLNLWITLARLMAASHGNDLEDWETYVRAKDLCSVAMTASSKVHQTCISIFCIIFRQDSYYLPEYLYCLLLFDGYVREEYISCLLYTSPSPRDGLLSRMPSSA
eukprot:TRINITY_DN8199_c0_g1_i2.p1 TRINITY_DN8199_c0_g1~~TRINITY_DN8199_c0_g1_i2.p1  ORF type:complete len:159 (-),score=25.30 TRINITY_DN8199_c0_g1_i2:78-554(-)